jgi:hypothetical protein
MRIENIYKIRIKKGYCCNAFTRAVKRKVIWKAFDRGFWRIDKPESNTCEVIVFCMYCGKCLEPKHRKLYLGKWNEV